MKPKLALSHPISAFFFLPSLVVISPSFRERTVESRTIPYSLPEKYQQNKREND